MPRAALDRIRDTPAPSRMGWSPDFTARVERRDLIVGVVGLGYVGLPTALGFLEAGFEVRGFDVNAGLVEALRRGENPGEDPTITDSLPAGVGERWRVSDDPAVLAGCDVCLVTVPTPVTRDLKPDLAFVGAAGATVFDGVQRGARTIVVLESTVYPGVTRQVWEPLLAQRGLSQGADIELAYCPERFNPGDPEHGVRQVARVIGSGDADVGRALVPFYQALTAGDVRWVGAIEVAEAAKVIENVQRDLNVALVNELAMVFPKLGLDLEDVLDAAATKWNFHRYTPGLGVGGHCIPVDPYYLMQRAFEVGVPTELIGAARAVNRSMPQHTAKAVLEILGLHGVLAREARVLLLGWAYKPGVGDVRETPAEPLAESLRDAGIDVHCWDPHVRLDELHDPPVNFHAELSDVPAFDCVVLVTAHQAIRELDWAALQAKARRALVFDGRRVLDLEELRSHGWKPYAIGRPLA